MYRRWSVGEGNTGFLFGHTAFVASQIDKFGKQCFCVATQLISLHYSHGWIPLFSFAEEYIRTKVTRHTNDEYELFTHVHTSKCVVTFVLRYAAASYYNSNWACE